MCAKRQAFVPSLQMMLSILSYMLCKYVVIMDNDVSLHNRLLTFSIYLLFLWVLAYKIIWPQMQMICKACFINGICSSLHKTFFDHQFLIVKQNQTIYFVRPQIFCVYFKYYLKIFLFIVTYAETHALWFKNIK